MHARISNQSSEPRPLTLPCTPPSSLLAETIPPQRLPGTQLPASVRPLVRLSVHRERPCVINLPENPHTPQPRIEDPEQHAEHDQHRTRGPVEQHGLLSPQALLHGGVRPHARGGICEHAVSAIDSARGGTCIECAGGSRAVVHAGARSSRAGGEANDGVCSSVETDEHCKHKRSLRAAPVEIKLWWGLLVHLRRRMSVSKSTPWKRWCTTNSSTWSIVAEKAWVNAVCTRPHGDSNAASWTSHAPLHIHTPRSEMPLEIKLRVGDCARVRT